MRHESEREFLHTSRNSQLDGVAQPGLRAARHVMRVEAHVGVYTEFTKFLTQFYKLGSPPVTVSDVEYGVIRLDDKKMIYIYMIIIVIMPRSA